MRLNEYCPIINRDCVQGRHIANGTIPRDIGAFLLNYIGNKNMTQRDLCNKTGIGAAKLCNIISGKNKLLIKDAHLLARVVGVSARELMLIHLNGRLAEYDALHGVK